MQKGNFLSETSYYLVKEVKYNGDIVVNILGTTQEATLSKNYVDALVKSARDYSTETIVNQTELIQIVLNNPRTAMSIYFKKADKDKIKKAYESEKSTKIQQISNAKVTDIPKLLEDLIENPITKIIPGELRLIVGYHENNQDERGYLQFFDAEKDNVFKAINTRTFIYAIINNTKYIIK